MSAAPAMVSIGDTGVLNREISPPLSEVWIDRDLGWLDFNDRVLAQALDNRTPLLERVKFLAIFTANLDEFFMKRVSVLRGGKTPHQAKLLAQVRERLVDSLRRQAECFRGQIIPALASHGIHLRAWDELNPGQQAEAARYFDDQVSAALTPLVFDPAHAFPFLSNLSTSLAFVLEDPEEETTSYARVKAPGVLPQWVPLETDAPAEQKVFVPLVDVIRGNIHKLYAGMKLTGTTLFRLTRDAEVEIEDEADDPIRDLVREQIRQRRYEPVVRLEFAPGADPSIREMLRKRFELASVDVYELATNPAHNADRRRCDTGTCEGSASDAGRCALEGELDYTSLFQIASLPVPELRDIPWTPLPPAKIDEAEDIFAAIRAGEVLVHHPYESFEDSVERFVAAAADDPQTVAVKMTAYRVGDDTPFVQSLVKAAESGKQVACVIEIKARFDEERNLHWAAELERVGAHVTFGVPGLKTHAKLALVVRKEAGGLRSYVHIGTGNYHVRTANLYSDIGLFTCNPAITRDVVNLFHYLTGHSVLPNCDSLLVAPAAMRPRLLDLIRREIDNQRAGRPARIVAKMNQLEDPELIEALCGAASAGGPARIVAKTNQLEDPELIEALCEAASAGVPVDLIVRGFCCLRPGVEGRSRGIRVRSIIGRFLEHSRIFHFAAAREDPRGGEFFIGSADWMYRNLSKRVEVVTPIFDPEAKAKLWEVLDICLRDRRQAWVLGEDGKYTPLQPEPESSGPEANGTHAALMELAKRASD